MSDNIRIDTTNGPVTVATDDDSRHFQLVKPNHLTPVASTATPLAAAATYDSTALATANFRYITGSVFADQAGNVFIEQSADGTNWDVSTTYAVAAGDGSGIEEPVLLPYFRIRYVNGETLQAAFRLNVYLRAA